MPVHADIDAIWASFKAKSRSADHSHRSAEGDLSTPKKKRFSGAPFVSEGVPFVRERTQSQIYSACVNAPQLATTIAKEAGKTPRSVPFPTAELHTQSPSTKRASGTPAAPWLHLLDSGSPPKYHAGQNAPRSISFSHGVGVARRQQASTRPDRALFTPRMPAPIPESIDFSDLDQEPPSSPYQLPMPEPAEPITLFCESPLPMSTFTHSMTNIRMDTFQSFATDNTARSVGLDTLFDDFQRYNREHAPTSSLTITDGSSTPTDSSNGTFDSRSQSHYGLGPGPSERESTLPNPFRSYDRFSVQTKSPKPTFLLTGLD